MRKRLMALVTLGAAVLAGCGLLPGVGGQQVLGSFAGNWGTVNQAKVRLALVGIGQGGLPTYDNQQEIKNINQFRSYVLELPTSAAEGAYRVYAYCDSNSDSRIGLNEAIADSGSKYLLYSSAEGTRTFFLVGAPAASLAVKRGWNGYDSATSAAPFQGESYPGYDLNLSGSCS